MQHIPFICGMNKADEQGDDKAYIERELKQIGKRIRQLRIDRGYTSHETFAYDFNFSRSQINGYERGKDIRFSTLLRIMLALKISPGEFFAEGFE